MHRLLVIEDDALLLSVFRYAFTEPEYEVVTATSAASGIAAFQQHPPDAVLLDIRLPDQSGLSVFQELHRLQPKIPIILMTGHGTAGTAIDAMRMGAFEYLVKPFEPERIEAVVQSAMETSRMMRVPAGIAEDADVADSHHDASSDLLVGQCAAMHEVYRAIGRAAAKNVTVLILGETGTGKEVVARALYQYGDRSERRFHAINCAAIPEQLLESELFGHERGAFTGADQKRIGKFELCDGGTLFLDEIGDMSPLMQTKILRVLQDQHFERVGSSGSIRTDVRLIAATNRNLEQMIADGDFRSDLFYRLNVYTIHLPPLRERGSDLDLLAKFFVRRFAAEFHKTIISIAPETLQRLRAHSWPGNVRELQGVLKRAVLEATGPVLVPAFLPAPLRSIPQPSALQPTSAPPTEDVLDLAALAQQRFDAQSHTIYDDCVGEAERIVLRTVLHCTGGNLTKAAERLGISRVTLRTKLRQLDVVAEPVHR